MKKAPLVFSLAFLLASFWWPVTASAKAPTIKVTISGGRLTTTLEITEPQVLALSSAWSGHLFDRLRTPESEPPKGLIAYEVSFFIKVAENDIRKNYVVFYYPNSPGEQGYIYLPGHGSPLWWLTAGSIMRTGRDGKWSYASPEWEALIKPTLMRAETALTSPSHATVKKISEPSASEPSEVSGEGWTRPHTGWLYVLDPRSESEHPGSRVWLLDPESARVMGSVRAGYDPDFALSPDGSYLYIASGERDSAELAIVNTASGKVRHIPFPERILYEPWYRALPPYSRMDVSSDRHSLRTLVPRVFSPEKIGYQLWTLNLDTENRATPRESVRLEDCGDCRNWLGSPTEWGRSQDHGRVYLGYGDPAPNGMAVSTGLRVLDAATRRQLGRMQTSVPFWSTTISNDGKLIYALAPEQHRVLVIDTATLQELRTIDVGRTPSLALVAP